MNPLTFPAERVETVRDFPLTDAGNRDYFAREVDRRLIFDNDAKRYYLSARAH